MADERPLLAVLVDADNTSPAAAKAIFAEIASFGEASVRRIYGDFTNPQMTSWNALLPKLGLTPHQAPVYRAGKNTADIELAIDAMDLLHTGRFKGFVLVSSDSDFTRLASRIREQGLDVYGIGKKNTHDAFRQACKRFIFIENLVDKSDDSEPARKPAKAADKSKAMPDQPAKEPPSKAIPLVLKAMNAIDPDAEWYSLSVLGKYLVQATPDFDTRTYNSAKLSDLLTKAGRFEVRKQEGNQLEVRRLD